MCILDARQVHPWRVLDIVPRDRLGVDQRDLEDRAPVHDHAALDAVVESPELHGARVDPVAPRRRKHLGQSWIVTEGGDQEGSRPDARPGAHAQLDQGEWPEHAFTRPVGQEGDDGRDGRIQRGRDERLEVGEPDLVEDLQNVDVVEMQFPVAQRHGGSVLEKRADVERSGQWHQRTPATSGWFFGATLNCGMTSSANKRMLSSTYCCGTTSMNWWMKLIPSNPTASH